MFEKSFKRREILQNHAQGITRVKLNEYLLRFRLMQKLYTPTVNIRI